MSKEHKSGQLLRRAEKFIAEQKKPKKLRRRTQYPSEHEIEMTKRELRRYHEAKGRAK